ncbi:MAG: cysteinyl-tRNA synthetase [Candidatus Atribacteria bacterium]|nr:cysteinyl-tRNA synthetase [Candidatus Atribacteria bacterium]
MRGGVAMGLSLFNSLTGQKEEFFPLHDKKVGFYVCGPTVYDFIHLGNARVFVVFDALRRFMEYLGYEVIFIQNFTDIDDKIIQRAQEMGKDPSWVAEHYIEQYQIDAGKLGIKEATYHPRATQHISDIIQLIETLEKKGFTYLVEGDVLFDVSRFPDYGKLSGKDPNQLLAGARVEIRYQKRNPADFVLWKKAKPGEPSWESPWGRGRPGWHIECSVMAMKYLGPTLDIHAGGIDLIFPHHENELAQSEAASGKEFVRYWLHNGYINIQNQKMSKSLGNVVNVRELTETYPPRAIRLALLFAHYRRPMNIDQELLESAAKYLERIKNLVRNLYFIQKKLDQGLSRKQETGLEVAQELARMKDNFWFSLADDFNTPQALAVLSDFIRFANQYLHPSRGKWSWQRLEEIKLFLKEVDQVLGIVPQEEIISEDREVIELVYQREQARREKKWEQADIFREKIRSLGYVVEDTPLGSRWYRAENEEN